MSKISEALADRREQRVTEARLRAEALASAKASMSFEARIEEDMKVVDKLMEDGNVFRITAEIADSDIASVTKAIYSGRLSEYKVTLRGNRLFIEKEIVDM